MGDKEQVSKTTLSKVGWKVVLKERQGTPIGLYCSADGELRLAVPFFVGLKQEDLIRILNLNKSGKNYKSKKKFKPGQVRVSYSTSFKRFAVPKAIHDCFLDEFNYIKGASEDSKSLKAAVTNGLIDEDNITNLVDCKPAFDNYKSRFIDLLVFCAVASEGRPNHLFIDYGILATPTELVERNYSRQQHTIQKSKGSRIQSTLYRKGHPGNMDLVLLIGDVDYEGQHRTIRSIQIPYGKRKQEPLVKLVKTHLKF